ncbi:hypothetical protein JCM9279_000085 [Rhodotorula babjevae]
MPTSPRERGAPSTRPSNSLRKARYLPAVSSSSPTDSSDDDDGSDLDPSAVPPEDPVDPLRRVNVMLQFLGAGALAVGSALLISLYVTGPPRLNDMATSSTAVLFMTLLIGCLAMVPSWAAALLILIQKKPTKGMPPHNPRWLRSAALLALLIAMLYVVAGIILFVVLEQESSFVSFCLQNIPSTTKDNCEERYNRAWLILLAVGLCFFVHVALGFPVYRYTRGPAYGVQLEGGFLLEPGSTARRHEADRRQRRSCRTPTRSRSTPTHGSQVVSGRRTRADGAAVASRAGQHGAELDGRAERRRAGRWSELSSEEEGSSVEEAGRRKEVRQSRRSSRRR